VVLCEVQEYSDLTYRLYDYGRRDANGQARELHVERALEVIQFGKSTGGKVAPVVLTGHGAKKYLLAACKYFAAERWEISDGAEFPLDAEHADIFVVLSGTGSFQNGKAAYHPGESWLMPANLKSLNVAPSGPTVLIRTFIPNLQELRDNLRRSGLDQAKISQIVFDS
jgi:mannose-6-phosphate isomerase